MEEIEHPNVYPKRLHYEDAVDFFLAYEVLRGAYFSVSTKEENESILLWSLCTMLDKDLPDIEEVVILIDHEYMHHLLYCLVGEWKSSSYDNIAFDVENWIFLMEEKKSDNYKTERSI